MKIYQRLAVFILLILLGCHVVSAANDSSASARATHVIKAKKKSVAIESIYKDKGGIHYKKIVANGGDSIYPLAERYQSEINKFMLDKHVVGMYKDQPVYVNKDWVDQLRWESGVAINLSELDEREKEEAKEAFNNLIFGENLIKGNVWYYLLAFFILTIICGFFIDQDNARSLIVDSIGAILFSILFAVEFCFCRFGMSMISDWMRGDSDFLSILAIIPKCLSVVIIVFYQYFIWYEIISHLGIRICGRKDFSLTTIIVCLALCSIGIACFFFIKYLPSIIYVSLALLVVDFVVMLIMNRHNIGVMIVVALLYITGVFAMFEMLCIFGLLLATIIAVIGVVFCIGRISIVPDAVKALVRKDGRVIGKIYKGSDTIHFTSGNQADLSQIHDSRIKIEYKDDE